MVGAVAGTARAVLLFGSHARREASAGSDVDVLVVDDGDAIRHVTSGHVSVFHYPWSTLLKGAGAGDLFVCHVAFEAMALVDPEDLLSSLRAAFAFRKDYADDIERARDLGWFLVRHGAVLDGSMVARRAVWCVRTILIARSAEDRRPVFSPATLAERTESAAGRAMLRHRHARVAYSTTRRRLRAFLEGEVGAERIHRRGSVDDFVARFQATGNETALSTVVKLREDPERYA